MAKYMIKLRILRGGGYPGLFVWAVKIITCVIIKSRQWEIRQTHRGGYRHTEEKVIDT